MNKKNNKCPNYGSSYRGEGSYTLSNSYDVRITIRNTQIINNSANVILGLSDKTIIQNSIIKNNKAEIILDTTSADVKINKCTIENNKATGSVIYHLIGQFEGRCNVTKTNFINNKGLLLKYGR